MTMGLEPLDIIFRLETAFSIEVDGPEVERLFGDTPWKDVTAGHIDDYVLSRVRGRWPTTPDGWMDCDVSGAVSAYNLRGLTPRYTCPQCGTPVDLEAHVWHGVCRVLEDALGATRQTIRREARLVGDLGAGM